MNSQSSSVVSSSITSKETFNVILPLRDAFWTSANQLRKISKLHRWHSEGCRRCSHWWISILHTSEKIQNHDLYPNLPQRFPYYLANQSSPILEGPTWPNNGQKHQSVMSQAPFLPPFEGPTKEFNLFSSRVHLQHLAQLQHFPPNWLFMTHGTKKTGDMVTRHNVATAVDTPGPCLRSICRDAVDVSILRA